MQLSATLSALFSTVFAATCMWFAIDAFTSTAVDPEQASSSEFAWFWVFLAVVGVVLGFASWKIAQMQNKDT